MNLKEMIKNKKVVTASIAVLLVAGIAIGGKVYADNEKAKEKARVELNQKEEQLELVKLGEDINSLFQGVIFQNGNLCLDYEDVISYGLKAEDVEKVKALHYRDKPKAEWDKMINELLDSAENQVKQIDTAKKAVEKVFKDNKVVNTDQKNIDAAKKEVDKIKNAKAKKELSDKLAKVKADIDKQNKTKEENKKEAEKASQQTSEAKTTADNVATKNNSSEQQVADAVGQQTNQVEQQAPQNNNGQDTGYYEPQAPATNNGTGTNQNVAPTAPTDNGNTGETPTPTPTPPAPEPMPEPEKPVGPPAGWIVPPYPVGSSELWIWLDAHGYSGFDHSDGYIRPY